VLGLSRIFWRPRRLFPDPGLAFVEDVFSEEEIWLDLLVFAAFWLDDTMERAWLNLPAL